MFTGIFRGFAFERQSGWGIPEGIVVGIPGSRNGRSPRWPGARTASCKNGSDRNLRRRRHRFFTFCSTALLKGFSCTFRTTGGRAAARGAFVPFLNAFHDFLKNPGRIGGFLRSTARLLLCLFGGFPSLLESKFFAVGRSLPCVRLTLCGVGFSLCFRRVRLRALCQIIQRDWFHNRRITAP